MKLSAYNIAIGVKQRRYPYKACIQSALGVADEFCIAYDPRFDDPQTFLAIDQRVRPIEVHYDFLEFDFINHALTHVLRSCEGDWCLLLSMDEVLHEKDVDNILRGIDDAEAQNAEALFLGHLMTCQGYIHPNEFLRGGRHTIVVNQPWLYHKTPPEGIGVMQSAYWDGKYIKRGFDDMQYFDARRNGRFLHEKDCRLAPYSVPASRTLEEEVKARVPRYVYIWHYARYNWLRKTQQGRQTAIWQDRTYARSPDLDVARQVELLQATIVMEPKPGVMEVVRKLGYVEVEVEHPVYVRDWLDSMGLEAR
ncbi:MAG: hypothetical protein ACYS30_19290 [Planctomycetota bacterium]|jgi:hypothetical protein